MAAGVKKTTTNVREKIKQAGFSHYIVKLNKPHKPIFSHVQAQKNNIKTKDNKIVVTAMIYTMQMF